MKTFPADIPNLKMLYRSFTTIQTAINIMETLCSLSGKVNKMWEKDMERTPNKAKKGIQEQHDLMPSTYRDVSKLTVF